MSLFFISVFFILFLGIGFENLNKISTHSFGIFPEDPLSFTLILNSMGKNLLTFSSSMWDGGFLFPYPHSLTLSENMMFSGVFYYFINLIGKEPILTLNILVLIFLYLNYLCMYFLLRLFLKEGSSVFGALIFSVSMIRIAHTCHTHLFPQFFFPLLLYGLVRYHKQKTLFWLLFSGVQLCLQFYFSLTLGMILTVSLIPYALWHLFQKEKNLKHIAITAITSLILVAPLALAFMKQGSPRKISDAYPFSANLKSYFTSPKLHLLGSDGVNQERFLFIGFLVLVFSVYGIIYLQKKKNPYRKLIYWSLAFCFIVSLGTNAGLYNVLYYIFPGMSGIRTPARFSLSYLFIMAGLAAIGLNYFLENKKLKWITPFVLFLFLLENKFDIPKTEIDKSLRGSTLFLKTAEKGPVLYYPTLDIDSHYMYEAVIHGQPIGNGFAGHLPEISQQVKKTNYTEIEKLKNWGFKYIVGPNTLKHPDLKVLYKDDNTGVYLLSK